MAVAPASEHTWRGRLGVAVGSLSIALGLYAIVAMLVVGLPEYLTEDYTLHMALPAIGFGVFALLAVPRQPMNNSVWVAVWTALLCGLAAAGYATTAILATASGIDMSQGAAETLTPADLPTAAALTYTLIGLVLVGYFLILTVGLLLFPNGELPSPRWRWVAWASIVTAVGFAVTLALEFHPASPTRMNGSSEEYTGAGRFASGLLVICVALAVLCLGSLVVRYRQTTGTTRQQYRWIAWGCGVFLLVLIAIVVAPGPMVPAMEGIRNDIQLVATLAGICALMVAYGVAVARYRLYDIDVVVSRTFVYGSLALFIGVVYVGIVVGVGYLLGIHDEPSPWLGVTATVVVAIAFQPLRDLLQRVANRIVYGRRATPYEVLSSFSRRLDAVDPDVFHETARSLAEGTAAAEAGIWVDRGGIRRVASWPPDGSLPFDSIDGVDTLIPIMHDGDRLGWVGLNLPAGHPLPPTDQRLLSQIAAGLGLALRNLSLTEDLKARVDQLRQSRRRIVKVQDETRHKLERDLHDGAQQRLVALKIKLGIASGMAEKGGLEDVKSILDSVRGETDRTIEALRQFARGIYPPLLEAEGLEPALAAQLRRAPIPVTVQAAGVGRYPKDIEATVYFSVLEAVQNAVKHAAAHSVTVTLSEHGGELEFEVRDDGVGFDPSPVPGAGLLNMADRIDAAAGTLQVETSPGRGTSVTGWVPVLAGAAS
jgi:signal transduction histidine kinase